MGEVIELQIWLKIERLSIGLRSTVEGLELDPACAASKHFALKSSGHSMLEVALDAVNLF